MNYSFSLDLINSQRLSLSANIVATIHHHDHVAPRALLIKNAAVKIIRPNLILKVWQSVGEGRETV